MLQDYRHLYRFFEAIADLPDLAPMDETVRAGAAWVLGKAGRRIVYLPEGGRVELDLSDCRGEVTAEWYNPREGKVGKTDAVEAKERLAFQAPDARDWVLHLHQAK